MAKKTPRVYLVEDVEYCPGRIYAVFSEYEDAENFAAQIDESTTIVERTLFYGQPSNRGYNK